MLGLKESTYYYKPKSHKKIEEDVKLKFEIEKLHTELPGYGYRRVTEHFKKNGIVINKKASPESNERLRSLFSLEEEVSTF